MPFNFGPKALIDATTFSKFFFGVDDATVPSTNPPVNLTPQQIFSTELLVNAVSQQIMSYVSSNIKKGTYSEVWDGAASDELVPTERPILSVSSFKMAANADWTNAQELVGSPGEPVYTDGNVIKLRYFRTAFARGVIQVIYDAGYQTIPDDITLAVLLQLQWAWKQLGKGDPMVGLMSINKMQEGQTKDPMLGKTGLRAEVAGMLEKYKRFEAPLSIMFTRVS